MATGKPASKGSKNGSGGAAGNGAGGYSICYEGKRAEAEILQGPTAEPERLGSVGRGHANRLYFGENAALLRTLLHDDAVRGGVRLVYIDPPYATGSEFATLSFGEGRTTVERLEAPIPNPDREPSKKERVLEAVEDLGRATAETVQKKTGIPLPTVRNSITELLSEGALRDTGEKQNRSRIVVTHSRTTKGTGTGTKGEGGGLFQEDEPEAHASACLCEECLPV